MTIQIDIPDDAIKQEVNINNDDIIKVIEFAIHYMFRVAFCYNISNSNIKISIK